MTFLSNTCFFSNCSPLPIGLPAHRLHPPFAGDVLLVVVHALPQLQDAVREVLVDLLTPHIGGVDCHSDGAQGHYKADT